MCTCYAVADKVKLHWEPTVLVTVGRMAGTVDLDRGGSRFKSQYECIAFIAVQNRL